MKELLKIGELTAKKISEVRTDRGYMQVLEYTLPDCSFLHIINWHFNNVLIENTFLPKTNTISFYKDKTSALSYAEEIGHELLKCN